jgi:hypothetical protein
MYCICIAYVLHMYCICIVCTVHVLHVHVCIVYVLYGCNHLDGGPLQEINVGINLKKVNDSALPARVVVVLYEALAPSLLPGMHKRARMSNTIDTRRRTTRLWIPKFYSCMVR